jgi:branched-chain amino acid transport system permease protein
MSRGLVPALSGTLAALALPLMLGNEFYLNMATQVLIYALFAVSLNILIGFGGMTSLGHAAHLGIAAYACAWLTANAGFSPLAAALATLLIGMAAAALFGLLALRASGLGFLMITLALGQIVWGIAYRWVALTGGDNGMRLAERPRPFGIDISAPLPFYYFVATIFAVALAFVWRLSLSPFGACLKGTRDQPRRMTMLGHNVWMMRWVAFIMAGFWGSVAGLLYIYYQKFISPHALSLPQSAEVLLMVILGGASTLTGPIVGAAVIVLVKNVVSSYVDRWSSLLGAIFIAVVVLMPNGLVPGLSALWRKWRSGKATMTLAGGAIPHEKGWAP